MSFKAIRENKILTKISGFTVYDVGTQKTWFVLAPKHMIKLTDEIIVKQDKFDEFISPDEGLLRETCKSQNINPILSSL